MKNICSNKKILLTTSLILVFAISIFGISKVFANTNIFKIMNITISDKSDSTIASITSFDDSNIVVNTEYHGVGEYVEYKLLLKNNSEKSYTIKTIGDTNNSPNIYYEYDRNPNIEMSAGEEKELTIKAIYKTELNDINNRNQNVNFTIDFTLLDEEDNEVITSIGVNPKTGDNILIYLILAISSFILLIFIHKKSKSKVLIPLLLLCTPTFINALDASVSINFDNITKIYDKMQVTVNIDGETTTEIVEYGTKTDHPDAPNKNGYTFDGWYVDDEEYDFNSDITNDIEMEARYNLIQYTITYDLNGGTATNVAEYNVETDSFDLVNPTKQGYNFAGWTGSNGNALQTRVTIEKGSIGNKNYTANFSARDDTPYTVIHKYKNLDGTFDTEEEGLLGVTATTVQPQIIYRHGFIEPELENLYIDANGESRLEYIYERANFNLTYNDALYIETDFTNESYSYGTPITVRIKDKPGYTFDYWLIGGYYQWGDEYTFTFNDDTLVSPLFTAKRYNIIFSGNNEEVYRDDYNQWATYGNEFELYDTWFATEHYTFAGQNTRADGNGTSYSNQQVVSNLTTEDSITLYAQWTPKTYTITFNSQGGSDVASREIEYNQVIGIPTSQQEGWDLEGWYQCPNGYCTKLEADTVATYDVTYYANWTVKQSHITFDEVGGSDEEDYDVNYNDNLYWLPYNGHTTKEGYVLEGWYLEPNYTTKVDESYIVTGNITLYAKWIKSVSSATIPEVLQIAQAPTGTGTITVDYGADEGEDYTFVLYDESVVTVEQNGTVHAVSEGEATVFVRGAVSYDWINVSVVVAPRQYTITFDSQGGEEVEPVIRDENSTFWDLPSYIYKDYYTFDGWYNDTGYGTRVGYNVPLTGDILVYAKWNKTECTDFQVDSWDTIYNNITTGNSDKYTLGCTKEITLGEDSDGHNLVNRTVRLVNNTRPEICETEGYSQTACGFVLEFYTIITRHQLFEEGITTTTGGWPATEARRYMNEDVYNALPNDLKSKVIDTYTVSGYGPDASASFETVDKLYAYNYRELYAKDDLPPTAYNVYEISDSYNRTRQMDYFYSKHVDIINNNYYTTHSFPDEEYSIPYITLNSKCNLF